KRFWDELTVDLQETRQRTEKLLDTETIDEVNELCDYQSVADKIVIAPETLKRLRYLSTPIESKKSWFKIAYALFIGTILAALGAGVIGIKELRNLLVDPATDLKDVQNNLIGLAVLLGLGSAVTFVYGVLVTAQPAARRAQYVGLFTADIEPCLRLAHVDPAT